MTITIQAAITTTMACTTGKSRLEILARSRRLMPGMVKTCSMIMLPVIISAAETARKLMTGIRAFFSTWRRSIWERLLPRLREVRT